MLIDSIKEGREKEGEKRPFEQRLFDRVAAVVRSFGLGQRFLEEMEAWEPSLSVRSPGLMRTRNKRGPEPVLFSLVSEDEYRVAVEIIEGLNNPYLAFAGDPEELLLSGVLFRINPNLGPEVLARAHLGAVLRHELARKDSSPVYSEESAEESRQRLEMIEKWISDFGLLK
jgi:hypothetical protein